MTRARLSKSREDARAPTYRSYRQIGEIHQIRTLCEVLKANTRAYSKALGEISCATKQGIISTGQGILVQEQGNLSAKTKTVAGCGFRYTHRPSTPRLIYINARSAAGARYFNWRGAPVGNLFRAKRRGGNSGSSSIMRRRPILTRRCSLYSGSALLAARQASARRGPQQHASKQILFAVSINGGFHG